MRHFLCLSVLALLAGCGAESGGGVVDQAVTVSAAAVAGPVQQTVDQTVTPPAIVTSDPETVDIRTASRVDIQLNLIGYENSGERLNYNYVLPSEEVLRYFSAKGFKTYRLTMRWERLQPQIMGPIAEDKAKELDDFITLAAKYRINVVPDLHNFGRRDGKRLGDPGLPVEALGDFWKKFAQRFPGKFYGYDLMNEPYDMPDATSWPRAAQIAVDQIRTVDKTVMIYVEGDDWSNAARWQQSNGNLNIIDPTNRLLYSAHIYFDKDTSGQYRNSFANDGVTEEIGAERLRPFVQWLRAKGFKGHIGEYGIPYADKGWYPVLDKFLDEAARSDDVLRGLAYWGAGTWMDFYDLTLQPANTPVWEDRPQLYLLLKKR